MLKSIDNEDNFGFHSEYYINPEWRTHDRDRKVDIELVTRKGYMQYSQYQGWIYFYGWHGDTVIKFNPETKAIEAFRINSKVKYEYIAVNRRGYFLYNTQQISLFGFDGREIYTYKFGQKNYLECIYIYDSKVFYSETKTANISSSIRCVDMITGEVITLWETQRDDDSFNTMLRSCYKNNWGSELPFFSVPSNIGNVSCEFLYANRNRVVAGYNRSKEPNSISYIINIDMDTHKWSMLDCIPKGDSRYKNSLPSNNARRIFSFNMLDDTMWVKTDDTDIRLVHTGIKEMAWMQGQFSVEWKVAAGFFDGYSHYWSSDRPHYFDGEQYYILEDMRFYQVSRNGEAIEADGNSDRTKYFWAFGSMYTIGHDMSWRDPSQGYRSIFYANHKDIDNLVGNAALLTDKKAVGTNKTAPTTVPGTVTQKTTAPKVNEPPITHDTVFFYCKTRNGADAKGYRAANGFTVCAGSKIVRNCTSQSFLKGNYYPLLNNLIDMGVIRDYIFTTDYTFASSSAAADVVTQGNVSGNLYWVDENGRKLKEYII